MKRRTFGQLLSSIVGFLAFWRPKPEPALAELPAPAPIELPSPLPYWTRLKTSQVEVPTEFGGAFPALVVAKMNFPTLHKPVTWKGDSYQVTSVDPNDGTPVIYGSPDLNDDGLRVHDPELSQRLAQIQLEMNPYYALFTKTRPRA